MHLRLSGWSDPERRFCSSLHLCCISEVFFGRTNRFTISGDQFGVRQVVLLRVSIFNITNCTRQTLNERGDTVVTFTAQTDLPFYGRASTNVVFPLFVHFRQVAGEDEGSPEPSARRTTAMFCEGSFRPGFSLAMASSSHFLILPR